MNSCDNKLLNSYSSSELTTALGIPPDFFGDPISQFSVIPYVVDTLEQSRADGNVKYSQNSSGNSSSTLFIAEDKKAVFREKLYLVDSEVERIVETSFEGFNNSVSGFSEIFQEFTEAQSRVRQLKDYVHKSKQALLSSGRNLNNLSFQRAQVSHALDILAEMDEVKSAPKILEIKLAKEQYAECVDIFQHAYSICSGQNLGSINALSEIRDNLAKFRETLTVALTHKLLVYLSGGNDGGNTGLLKFSHVGLSKEAVGSLNEVIVALRKLKYLHTALESVKLKLRDNLDSVIRSLMARFNDYDVPTGMSLPQEEVDNVRTVGFFRKVFSFFEGLLARHVQFDSILNIEVPESMRREYSLKATWSIIQAHVQNLLELHFSPSNSWKEPSQMLKKSEKNEDSSRIKFRFAVPRDLSGKEERTDTVTGFKHICIPSSYSLFSLLKPLHRFSTRGDEIAGTEGHPQLLGYIRDFCDNTLLPAILADGVDTLKNACDDDDFAFQRNETTGGTVLSDVFFEQFGRIASHADSLSLINCNLDAALLTLVSHFQRLCENKSEKLTTGKLCETFFEETGNLKDPVYSVFSSETDEKFRSSELSISEDPIEWNKSCRDFVTEERRIERELVRREPCLSDPSDDTLKSKLLSMSQMAALSALQFACDLVFDILVNGHESIYVSSAFSTQKTFNVGSKSKNLIQVLESPSLQPVWSSARFHKVLRRVDRTLKYCLLSLRSDLRIRCIGFLRCLSLEMNQHPGRSSLGSSIIESQSDSFECTSELAQDLVHCMRAVTPRIAKRHRSYVQLSLCCLLSEIIVRALQFSEHKTMQTLDRKLLHLQKTMWTLLLSTFNEENINSSEPMDSDCGYLSTVTKKLTWKVVREQLGAFDGARHALLGMEVQNPGDAERNFSISVDSLYGAVTLEELKQFKNLAGVAQEKNK